MEKGRTELMLIIVVDDIGTFVNLPVCCSSGFSFLVEKIFHRRRRRRREKRRRRIEMIFYSVSLTDSSFAFHLDISLPFLIRCLYRNIISENSLFSEKRKEKEQKQKQKQKKSSRDEEEKSICTNASTVEVSRVNVDPRFFFSSYIF